MMAKVISVSGSLVSRRMSLLAVPLGRWKVVVVPAGWLLRIVAIAWRIDLVVVCGGRGGVTWSCASRIKVGIGALGGMRWVWVKGRMVIEVGGLVIGSGKMNS